MPLFKRAKTKKDSPRIDSSIAHTGFSPPSQSAVPQVDVAATAMKNSQTAKKRETAKKRGDEQSPAPPQIDPITAWIKEWDLIEQDFDTLFYQFSGCYLQTAAKDLQVDGRAAIKLMFQWIKEEFIPNIMNAPGPATWLASTISKDCQQFLLEKIPISPTEPDRKELVQAVIVTPIDMFLKQVAKMTTQTP